MKFKKILSVLLAASFTVLSAISVSAFELSDGTEVDMDDAIVESYRQQLYARGLSEQNIYTLANLGFHLDEMVRLSESELNAILGKSRGKTSRAIIPTYTVTGIPDNLYGDTSKFTTNSGMTNGDFYEDNNGYYIQYKVDTFSKNSMPDADSYSNMYYLYGEYDPDIGVHQGVDIQPSPRQCNVYSQHSGIVVDYTRYGAIGIYDSSVNRTFYYLHMRSRQVSPGDTVSYGDYLGISYNTGLPTGSGIHLHFEVAKGKDNPQSGEQLVLKSLSPYQYMA